MTRLARATGPLGTFLLALLAACGPAPGTKDPKVGGGDGPGE